MMRDPIPRAGENYVFTEGVHINFCYTKLTNFLAFSQIEIQTVSFSCSFRATIQHTSTSTSAATNVKRGHDDDTTPSTNHVVYRERPQQQQQQQQPESNNKKKSREKEESANICPSVLSFSLSSPRERKENKRGERERLCVKMKKMTKTRTAVSFHGMPGRFADRLALLALMLSFLAEFVSATSTTVYGMSISSSSNHVSVVPQVFLREPTDQVSVQQSFLRSKLPLRDWTRIKGKENGPRRARG